jgi:hypothetical protein
MQPHEDPFEQARQVPVQVLAVLMSCGEGLARFATVEMQRREARTHADAAAARTREQAQDLQARRDTELVNMARDDTWLARARVGDLAPAWRAAVTLGAAGDERARVAVDRIETRLREVAPSLMGFYDQQRSAGVGRSAAMRTAGEQWLARWVGGPGQTARAHGARPEPNMAPTAITSREAYDEALANELTRLAQGVNPADLRRLQSQRRAAGLGPAADAAGLLREYAYAVARDTGMPDLAAEAMSRNLAGFAGQERGVSNADYGQQDLHATAANERWEGQVAGHFQEGAADQDAAKVAAMARRARLAFPPPGGSAGSGPTPTGPNRGPSRPQGRAR